MLDISIAQTSKLTIYKLIKDDPGFLFKLLNEPAFLEFIDKKGVRTIDNATDYLNKYFPPISKQVLDICSSTSVC